MSKYMLDTDISSYIMKRSHPGLLKKLQTTPIPDVCVSVITKCELMFGVEISPADSRTNSRSKRTSLT